MEYVYAALLLHSANQEITEEGITKILDAAGINVDSAKVKALVSSLEGVNIDEAIKTTTPVVGPVAVQQPEPAPTSAEEKPEEKKEEKKKKEEEEEADAMAGLGALFG
ncbi:MAG: 50S ribosomal protein P1 [Methanobacteriota archaeon]|nr:MAG: 50S ribosomal protein P1 [Euryarchaeota archaeon]